VISCNKNSLKAIKKYSAKQSKSRATQLVRAITDIKLQPSELEFVSVLNKQNWYQQGLISGCGQEDL